MRQAGLDAEFRQRVAVVFTPLRSPGRCVPARSLLTSPGSGLLEAAQRPGRRRPSRSTRSQRWSWRRPASHRRRRHTRPRALPPVEQRVEIAVVQREQRQRVVRRADNGVSPSGSASSTARSPAARSSIMPRQPEFVTRWHRVPPRRPHRPPRGRCRSRACTRRSTPPGRRLYSASASRVSSSARSCGGCAAANRRARRTGPPPRGALRPRGAARGDRRQVQHGSGVIRSLGVMGQPGRVDAPARPPSAASSARCRPRRRDGPSSASIAIRASSCGTAPVVASTSIPPASTRPAAPALAADRLERPWLERRRRHRHRLQHRRASSLIRAARA